MHRKIDQINVSITTNRGCNLRCEHCYIMPHVFKDPSMMTTDTVRMIFDRVEELKALDGNLREIEWEAIGGETTLMPFEWWQEMLPYMLDRIDRINKTLKIPGSLNFLTNLMIRDDRYFDLFNDYADHPAFVIYTSWEPDTRRFGSRNKLFPRFLANMDRLKQKQLILDIIMTREVCELGGKWVVDTFVPHGVTDFSCKMLSPYGSGKAFFSRAMTDFAAMSRFLAELDAACPKGVTYTPSEEALSSLYRGSSFQCNGNFYYDLSIEPDGRTHFNANQTAEESVSGGLEIRLEDPNWARKVVFGNSQEAAGKLTLAHPGCHQCEFLRYCNAGWWHYKTDQDLIAPYRGEECPGLSRHWRRKKAALQGSVIDVSLLNHLTAMRKAITERPGRAGPPDTRLATLDRFLAHDAADGPVDLAPGKLHGRSLPERLVWYDALGIGTSLDPEDVGALERGLADQILGWQIHGVLQRTVPLSDAAILKIAAIFPAATSVGLLRDAIAIVAGRTGEPGPALAARPSGLIVDARNDEVFRFAVDHLPHLGCLATPGLPPLDAREAAWLAGLRAHIARERAARAIGSTVIRHE